MDEQACFPADTKHLLGEPAEVSHATRSGAIWRIPFPETRTIPPRPTWALSMAARNDATSAPGADDTLSPVRHSQPSDRRTDRYLREQEEGILAGQISANQARSATASWLATLAPWDLYVTLTYDPMKVGTRRGAHRLPGESTTSPVGKPPGFFACQHHLQAWVQRSKDALHRPVFCAGAYELTHQSWPHWHGLVAMGGVSATAFVALSRAWYERHGFARFERIKPGTEGVIAAYIAKYFTKQDESIALVGGAGLATPVFQPMLTRTEKRQGKKWKPG